jgi:hypothetical protein
MVTKSKTGRETVPPPSSTTVTNSGFHTIYLKVVGELGLESFMIGHINGKAISTLVCKLGLLKDFIIGLY